MSDFKRAATEAVPVMNLPRVSGSPASIASTVNQAWSQIERADRQNVKRLSEAAFPSILLQAADGSTYRLTVTDTGGTPTLTLTQVPVRAG